MKFDELMRRISRVSKDDLESIPADRVNSISVHVDQETITYKVGMDGVTKINVKHDKNSNSIPDCYEVHFNDESVKETINPFDVD